MCHVSETATTRSVRFATMRAIRRARALPVKGASGEDASLDCRRRRCGRGGRSAACGSRGGHHPCTDGRPVARIREDSGPCRAACGQPKPVLERSAVPGLRLCRARRPGSRRGLRRGFSLGALHQRLRRACALQARVRAGHQSHGPVRADDRAPVGRGGARDGR